MSAHCIGTDPILTAMAIDWCSEVDCGKLLYEMGSLHTTSREVKAKVWRQGRFRLPNWLGRLMVPLQQFFQRRYGWHFVPTGRVSTLRPPERTMTSILDLVPVLLRPAARGVKKVSISLYCWREICRALRRSMLVMCARRHCGRPDS